MTRFNLSLPNLPRFISKTTRADSIAMKVISPTSGRTGQENEPEDPITLEPISSYDPADVFTTLEGKQYHLPSLKIWLQDHDTLPHNRGEALKEIDRIWPQATMARNRKALMGRIKIGTSVAAVGSSIAVIAFLVKTIPEIFIGTVGKAVHRCLSVSGQGFSNCADTNVPLVEAEWARDRKIFGPLAGAFLGLTIGLIATTVYARKQSNKAIIVADRPITEEDRRKAGLVPQQQVMTA